MRIGVLGLGYVGCVTAACLASHGHRVIGVDVSSSKVDAVNNGSSPIIERGLDELICDVVRRGDLRATTNTGEAVAASEVLLICVGTPSNANGSLNLKYVKRVCAEIGHALAATDGYKVIVFRSTLLPGVLRNQLIPLLIEASGKQPGCDFGVATNPEFLREGSAIEDFNHPAMTLIGEADIRAGDVLESLYSVIEAPIRRTDPDTASMVKYASNAFHALKITFANEVGQLCSYLNIDGTRVMEIFAQDTRLNTSAAYLKPGFAFGGSCLPKDLRALVYMVRHADISAPVLEHVLPSNDERVEMTVNAITRTGKRRIAIDGLSFKPNTDDLRESPFVRLVESLLGKGLQVRIFDININLARLVGSNRAYIDQAIPHIAVLICDSLEAALDDAEVVIASHGVTPALQTLLAADQQVIDLSCIRVENQLEYAYEEPII